MKNLKFAAKHLATQMNLRTSKSEVYQRHQALKEVYDNDPKESIIYDSAVVKGENLKYPFRTTVLMNPKLNTPLKTGLHKAVGGDHDYPNPGDILCAALATCFESTMRMIANRLELELTHTKVKVTAMVDVKGTLMFDRSVPVAFQNMQLDVELGAKDASPKILKTLFSAAKRSCVVYQTLKPGVVIHKNLEIVG